MTRFLTTAAMAAGMLGLTACDGREPYVDSAGESATAAEPGTPAAMERQAAIADAPDIQSEQGAPGLEADEYVSPEEADDTGGAEPPDRGDDDPTS